MVLVVELHDDESRLGKRGWCSLILDGIDEMRVEYKKSFAVMLCHKNKDSLVY